MLRRLLGLLIALAIAVALPSFGGSGPIQHGMTAQADCACSNAADDCGQHGEPGCAGALACAVQCGAATPMLGIELRPASPAQAATSHPMTSAALPVSPAAALPYRPPTASIPA